MNIMNEIDVDHNGKLDFPEFVIMMRDKLSGEDMEQEIRQAFRYVSSKVYIKKNPGGGGCDSDAVRAQTIAETALH